MALGNRGFVQGLASEAAPAAPLAKLPPRTSILQSRENRLAQLAAGQSVSRVHELVDPARCRIWEGHNRDYTALDETACADLIQSFTSHGRQEVPAIVRRIRGDAEHDFEVICGARRHWTASWLRAHGQPSFGFLVEPRELDDEEAFRVADLENRSRRDLTDLERARDYARAVERYYDGNQQRMAERLQVTKSWLSRYLELARLPQIVVAAFGANSAIGISHAAQLAPVLRAEAQRDAVLAEAEALVAEQRTRKGEGSEPIGSAGVVQRLLTAARPRQPASRPMICNVKDKGGAVIAKGVRVGRGITITLPHPGRAGHRELLDACAELLQQLEVGTDADGTRARGAKRKREGKSPTRS